MHRSRYRHKFEVEMDAVRKLNDQLNREATKLRKAIDSSFTERERMSTQHAAERAQLQGELEHVKQKLAQAVRQVRTCTFRCE